MNCTFVETEFFYLTHSRVQGEPNANDGTLEWLSNYDCLAPVPTRQVDGADCAIAPDNVLTADLVPSPNDQPNLDVRTEVRTGNSNDQSFPVSLNNDSNILIDDSHTNNPTLPPLILKLL